MAVSRRLESEGLGFWGLGFRVAGSKASAIIGLNNYDRFLGYIYIYIRV